MCGLQCIIWKVFHLEMESSLLFVGEMKILLGILLKMAYYRNDRRRHVPEEGVDASTLIGKQRYFRINRFEPLFC